MPARTPHELLIVCQPHIAHQLPILIDRELSPKLALLDVARVAGDAEVVSPARIVNAFAARTSSLLQVGMNSVSSLCRTGIDENSFRLDAATRNALDGVGGLSQHVSSSASHALIWLRLYLNVTDGLPRRVDVLVESDRRKQQQFMPVSRNRNARVTAGHRLPA